MPHTPRSPQEFWIHNPAHIPRTALLGNTHTPDAVATMLVNMIPDTHPFFQGVGRFADPCVGAGAFYLAVYHRAVALGAHPIEVLHRMDAWDVDPVALNLFRGHLSKAIQDHGYTDIPDGVHITHGDFLRAHPTTPYHLIATNPPYVRHSAITDPMGHTDPTTLRAQYQDIVPDAAHRADLYMYFTLRCLDLLDNGGTCLLLCSGSWLGAQFGAPLRHRYRTGGGYHLHHIHHWGLYPPFRDDTQAIGTYTIKGSTGPTTVYTTDDPPTPEMRWTARSIPLEGMDDILEEPATYARARLLLAGATWEAGSAWEDQHDDLLTTIGTVATIHTSPITIRTVTQDTPHDSPGDLPIFWQIQARSNRPGDYRHHPNIDALPRISSEQAQTLSLPTRTDPIWMSSIIDRWPLWFHTPGTYGHISKYLALHSDHDPMFLLALLTSWPALHSMELRLPEGTRKTLRTHSHGVTKEIRARDLAEIRIPHPACIPDPMRHTLMAHESRYATRVYANIMDTIHDPDWMTMQGIIFACMGMEARSQRILIDRTMELFWRRHRHQVYIHTPPHIPLPP